MGCNCGQRRGLAVKAAQNVKAGDLRAAQQNVKRIVQSVKVDARKLGRSIINSRPR